MPSSIESVLMRKLKIEKGKATKLVKKARRNLGISESALYSQELEFLELEFECMQLHYKINDTRSKRPEDKRLPTSYYCGDSIFDSISSSSKRTTACKRPMSQKNHSTKTTDELSLQSLSSTDDDDAADPSSIKQSLKIVDFESLPELLDLCVESGSGSSLVTSETCSNSSHYSSFSSYESFDNEAPHSLHSAWSSSAFNASRVSAVANRISSMAQAHRRNSPLGVFLHDLIPDNSKAEVSVVHDNAKLPTTNVTKIDKAVSRNTSKQERELTLSSPCYFLSSKQQAERDEVARSRCILAQCSAVPKPPLRMLPPIRVTGTSEGKKKDQAAVCPRRQESIRSSKGVSRREGNQSSFPTRTTKQFCGQQQHQRQQQTEKVKRKNDDAICSNRQLDRGLVLGVSKSSRQKYRMVPVVPKSKVKRASVTRATYSQHRHDKFK